jgi:hypothetical protein
MADLALAMSEVDEAVYLGHQLVDSLRSKRAPATLCTAQLNLMHALLVHGSFDEASRLSREGVPLASDCGLLWQAADTLAWLAAVQGDLQTAAQLAGWSDAASRRRGEPEGIRRSPRRETVQSMIDSLPPALRAESTSTGAALGEADVVALWDRATAA